MNGGLKVMTLQTNGKNNNPACPYCGEYTYFSFRTKGQYRIADNNEFIPIAHDVYQCAKCRSGFRVLVKED